MQDILDRMRDRVLRHAIGTSLETAIPRVALGVLSENSLINQTMCSAGICLVLQGTKQMLLGDQLLRFDVGSCFVSLIDLPATSCSYAAQSDNPYVAAGMFIDQQALMALIEEFPGPPSLPAPSSYSLDTVSRPLLEAWDHHLALLDSPDDIPALAQPRERELLYRLLQSSHGAMLRQMAQENGKLAKVRRAIEWLAQHFNEPLAIKTLADIAGMSVPSFNRHFKAATATSPLQYQKTLRLQAARRILATNADAAYTAFEVGYGSASQFSREYARFFGLPPKQDAANLQLAKRPTSKTGQKSSNAP